MQRSLRLTDAAQSVEQILEIVRLGEHAKEVGAVTDLPLDPLGRRHVVVPDTVSVRIGMHLELEIGNESEAEGTVPA